MGHLTLVLVVEVAMKKCIVREKQKSSVDFLTEFVLSVCDARANRRSISTVSMKSVNRLERVRFFALLIYSIPMFTINY